MSKERWTEILYVKAEEESILTYGNDDNADRQNLCQNYWIFCNGGEYIKSDDSVLEMCAFLNNLLQSGKRLDKTIFLVYNKYVR